ncbi:MAG: S1 RNA-binding domain-containing protein [Promicromonosporaceae bacterium]|nr:S1 RNA-binding domain-containing protein [Promicromonosporaceae bacterium]
MTENKPLEPLSKIYGNSKHAAAKALAKQLTAIWSQFRLNSRDYAAELQSQGAMSPELRLAIEEARQLAQDEKRAKTEAIWNDLEATKDSNASVTGTVVDAVKGGLRIDMGLPGYAFLPASRVDIRRITDLSSFVGQKIDAKIIELDKERNKVVLSRRAVLEEQMADSRKERLAALTKGQILPGTVRSLTDFGAFVDLGGIDGLVHLSELSWRPVEHPARVVQVGEKVLVEVLGVDLNKGKVALSLKATREDPWQTFIRTHVIGQLVAGRVKKLVDFGAFITLEDGTEGLLHISQLANRRIEQSSEVLAPGQDIIVKILDIDPDKRKISLSLKEANRDIDPDSEDFDAALYGLNEYDEFGEYQYPEGFDPESGEWIEGFEAQRDAWEAAHGAAFARWEMHRAQAAAARETDIPAFNRRGDRPSGGRGGGRGRSSEFGTDDGEPRGDGGYGSRGDGGYGGGRGDGGYGGRGDGGNRRQRGRRGGGSRS